MSAKQIMQTRFLTILLVVMAALAPVFVTGCSKEEEPAPPPAPEATAPAPAVAEPAAPIEAPAAPVAAAAGPTPVTLDVLRLMPESTTIALALPPVNGIWDKAIALAKRVAPVGTDVDAEAQRIIADMAGDAGVPDAKSLAEIAAAKGLDAGAPLAAFVDLSRTASAAQKALAELPTTGSPPTPEQMQVVMDNLEAPEGAVVLPVADAAKVEQTLKDLMAQEGSTISADSLVDTDAGGITIRFSETGQAGYFLNENKVVIGNSLRILQEVAARFKAPATTRYGTAGMEAGAPDEAVALAYMGRLMPMIEPLMPALLALNPQMAPMASLQMKNIETYAKAFAPNEASVTTLLWNDQMIQLMSRMDETANPGLKEAIGESKPLRFAPLLPEQTLFILSQRINDKMKEQFKVGSGAAGGDPNAEQIMATVGQVVEMVGDEITIGLANSGGGFPHLLVMAGLSKPQEAKDFIQTLAPMTPSETHNNVEVSLLTVPAPLPFYIAFPADTMIVSNDADKIKQTIDMIEAGGSSPLLAGMTPAVDSALPRSSFVSLDTRLISEVVMPLAGMLGAMPAEFQEPAGKVVEVLREVRIDSVEDQSILKSSVTLYLQQQ